jgi:hypothetical protein
VVASEIFDPIEFYRIAEFLAGQDSSEASLRTAVSRMYYAAFLASRDSLQVLGRRHVHGRVIGELRRHDRYAGDQLEKLEVLRGLADYQMEAQNSTRSDWQQNYLLARQLARFVLERLP